jgi:hypothetical protein
VVVVVVVVACGGGGGGGGGVREEGRGESNLYISYFALKAKVVVNTIHTRVCALTPSLSLSLSLSR